MTARPLRPAHKDADTSHLTILSDEDTDAVIEITPFSVAASAASPPLHATVKRSVSEAAPSPAASPADGITIKTKKTAKRHKRRHVEHLSSDSNAEDDVPFSPATRRTNNASATLSSRPSATPTPSNTTSTHIQQQAVARLPRQQQEHGEEEVFVFDDDEELVVGDGHGDPEAQKQLAARLEASSSSDRRAFVGNNPPPESMVKTEGGQGSFLFFSLQNKTKNLIKNNQ